MTTITLPRATVEQALEALEDAKALLNNKDRTTTMWFADEITALRAALAQQAEPVDQTTLDVSGTTSFSAIPPKLPEPYAGKAARLNNDRIQIDPATGNVSIGAQQAEPGEPVQQPYCYVYEYDGAFGLHREFYPKVYNGHKPDRTVPVYTSPPQRKPLTEEEIMDAFHAARNAKLGASQDNSKHRLSVVEIARAVERAHGIGGNDE